MDVAVVHWFSHVHLFATPWTTAHSASLSFTISQSLLKLMFIALVMPPNHLILCHPFSSCLPSFPASGSFLMSQLFASGGQSIGASASASVPLVNSQDWFPLGLTGLILQSKGLFKSLLQHHSSKASILRHSAFFMVQFTSIHDYWKNHSFDYIDLCRQRNVPAF